MTHEANQAIVLIIPPLVQQLLTERGIREEDLRPVIGAAQASGRFLRQHQGDHLLAHARAGEDHEVG